MSLHKQPNDWQVMSVYVTSADLNLNHSSLTPPTTCANLSWTPPTICANLSLTRPAVCANLSLTPPTICADLSLTPRPSMLTSPHQVLPHLKSVLSQQS